jgi:hypothetical protein
MVVRVIDVNIDIDDVVLATLVHDHGSTGDGHEALLHGTRLSAKYPLWRLDTPWTG